VKSCTPPQDADALYTCLEVLEHLEDDLALIYSFPSGARLVFSVPSYDNEAYVRFFPQPLAAFERYSDAVELASWERVSMGPGGRHINLFVGHVGGDRPRPPADPSSVGERSSRRGGRAPGRGRGRA
jgi:hypothetical protein